ncbi:hypothetical protein AURDEDRAFT_178354 [Auricularia subglabra TFB-10046 SS5]|uniref:Uncharacterized protein n=1 Tax=Auricularia subglabra (strain TFB-10046 / SS5) TaxID=717982 RepID=J0D1U3_AURST|nr:hypothetical protein AURDEDRAFT_178354 [Auricularia subglabra TFB-10046 SS5]
MSDILIEDDDERHVSYYPAGAWEFLSESKYHASTYHMTSTPGAYMTFTFSGSFVEYYSDLHNDHGAFTASLDGEVVFSASSQSKTLLEQRVLFSSAVSPGHHVLTITNGKDMRVTGVDYFVYRGDSNNTKINIETDGHAAVSWTTVAQAHRSQAISTCVAFALLISLATVTALSLARKRRRRREHRDAPPPPYTAPPQLRPPASHDDRHEGLVQNIVDARRDKLRNLGH